MVTGTLLVIVVLASLYTVMQPKTTQGAPEELEALATCLTDSGATFYGAFWCGHCISQKRAFGNAFDLLPYVECSTPDGRDQIAECAAAGITGYPTWEFADGTRVGGEIALSALAAYSGCPAPGATGT